MINDLKRARKAVRNFAQRLRRDQSGVALIEFAYTLPFLTILGFFGLEMTNLALVNLRVSQAALALADNISRVGATTALATVQVRESDVNDSLIGAIRQTGALNVATGGRIILSSLEQNAAGGQWIHWQRCIGTKNVVSLYGAEGTGATGTSFLGMGKASARIAAPPNSAVMFVEVTYDYKPIFNAMFIGTKSIRYEASFVARDQNRDLTQLFNPSPTAVVHSCSTFLTS
jgi:hypothetical protein